MGHSTRQAVRASGPGSPDVGVHVDVAITGSTGLVGEALVASLAARGHSVRRLVRRAAGPGEVRWDPQGGTIDAAALAGIDACVHLAGEGIAEHKWSEAQKQRILESRTRGTDLVARTLAALDSRPSVLVSASAIGYYGDRGDEELVETTAPGDDFLARVCVAWEAATAPAADAGIRVVPARSGIILDAHGGALSRMLLPFKLGLGGRLGSGRQYMSWISLDDEVGGIVHALEHPDVVGPMNLTAPTPVTNAEFTATLGRVLRRPTLLPTPLLPLRLRYGAELIQHLLLDSARVLPAALERSGYTFVHQELEAALRHAIAR